MLIKGSMEKNYGLRPVFAPELQTSYAMCSRKFVCKILHSRGPNGPEMPDSPGPVP
jgi:hypothetical protein